MTKIQNIPTVSAIVCAYNEENTIEAVVEALLRSKLVEQTIVVDDGSTDATAEKLAKFTGQSNLELIYLPENRGKGYAMTEAASRANGEIILFVDADLKKLAEVHLYLLLEPLLKKEADMVIGFPIRGKSISSVERLDPCRALAGQRALYRSDFMTLFKPIRYSGYGVETILNLHYREQGKPIKAIFLPHLIHLIKTEKKSFAAAAVEYVHEGFQIIRTAIKNPSLVWGAIFGSHKPLKQEPRTTP